MFVCNIVYRYTCWYVFSVHIMYAYTLCTHCDLSVFVQELNLYSSSTFRDLSRPMGAQTPERLKQFEKRYSDWDDPTGC